MSVPGLPACSPSRQGQCSRHPSQLSDWDSDLAQDKRQCVETLSFVLERLNGPAGAGGEAHYYGIAT